MTDDELKAAIERELKAFVREGRKHYLNSRNLIKSAGSTFHILLKDEASGNVERCDMKAIYRAATSKLSGKVGSSGALQKRLKELGFEVETDADRPDTRTSSEF